MDQVGIYYSNQPSESEPSLFLPRDEVRQLKRDSGGWFINHGKHFRLAAEHILEPDNEKLLQALKARDRSAQMPPSITEQYVDGHKGAVAIVEAWA